MTRHDLSSDQIKTYKLSELQTVMRLSEQGGSLQSASMSSLSETNMWDIGADRVI